jgi:hypothetical protein
VFVQWPTPQPLRPTRWAAVAVHPRQTRAQTPTPSALPIPAPSARASRTTLKFMERAVSNILSNVYSAGKLTFFTYSACKQYAPLEVKLDYNSMESFQQKVPPILFGAFGRYFGLKRRTARLCNNRHFFNSCS